MKVASRLTGKFLSHFCECKLSYPEPEFYSRERHKHTTGSQRHVRCSRGDDADQLSVFSPIQIGL